MSPRCLVALSALAACNATTSLPASLDGGRPDVLIAPADGVLLPRDGSRLRATWFVTPEGQPSFAGWYDNRLRIQCRVGLASDDEWRCLPIHFDFVSAFSDPGCSKPIWIEYPCESPTYVYRTNTSDPCRTRLRAFRVGEETLPVAPTYQMTVNGCQQTAGVPSWTFRRLSEVPPRSFVSMSDTLGGSEGPVHPRYFDGADGSRQLSGYELSSTSDACSVVRLEDGRDHCIPSSRTTDASFADSACSEPLVRYRPACEPAPKLARRRLADACATALPLHEVGPPADAAFQVRASDNMCLPADPTPDYELRTLGKRVPDDTYPVLETVTGPGPQRLRRRTRALGGGPAPHLGWFDSVRNESCSPAYLERKLRCVPFASTGTPLFADDKCTRPLYTSTTTVCAAARPEYQWAVQSYEECPFRLGLYRITTPYIGPVFYQFWRREGADRQIVNKCQSAEAPADRQLYATEPVAATEFVELQLAEP